MRENSCLAVLWLSVVLHCSGTIKRCDFVRLFSAASFHLSHAAVIQYITSAAIKMLKLIKKRWFINWTSVLIALDHPSLSFHFIFWGDNLIKRSHSQGVFHHCWFTASSRNAFIWIQRARGYTIPRLWGIDTHAHAQTAHTQSCNITP